MNKPTLPEKAVIQQKSLLLGVSVGGLVYENRETGELSTNENEVLKWVSNGVEVKVSGYYTFEWNGAELDEVWHH